MTALQKFPEWQTPPVHPAAKKLPMMSDIELDELAADIKANGLLEPIVLWRDNREEANGATGPFDLYLLDGRNRLAALERLGIADPRRAPHGPKTVDTVRILRAVHEYSGMALGGGKAASGWKTEVDPTVYVLSANVRRRHLTSEQKRQAIADYITADPKASNLKVARTLGVDDKTVASVRSGPDSEIPKTDHLPIERAKDALRADPTMSKRQLMEAASVGSSTALNARKDLEAAGEIPPKPSSTRQQPQAPTPKPTPAAKPKPKAAAEPTEGSTAPRNLVMRKLRNDLVAFSEDQIGKLHEIEDGEAASDDIAEYIAAVNQVATKLKAAANRIAADGNKEVQSK